MFMRFQGGTIGHKAMCEWDETLSQDVGWPVDDEGDAEIEGAQLQEPQEPQEDNEEEPWAAIMKQTKGPEDLDSDGKDRKDDDPDRVVADEGEELDDGIFAHKGYDTL